MTFHFIRAPDYFAHCAPASPPSFLYLAIAAYNTLLLSRVYEQKLAADDQEAIKIIRGTSPVAWRDVNLIGNFDFAARTSQVDIEALAARYNDPDFWRRSMQESDDEPAE